MALRCASRSLMRNFDSSSILRQSLTLTAFSRTDHSNQTLPPSRRLSPFCPNASEAQGQFQIVRHFSLAQNLSNAQDSIVSSENDFSIVDASSSSSSSAESLIRAQVDEVMTTLPLTERLFAVVQINGNQFRVSQDDVLTVEDW